MTINSNKKSKITIEDDIEENQVQEEKSSNSKSVEELLRRIEELEKEKGTVNSDGKKIYGNQNTGKLWGKRIQLTRGNQVFKDFPYVLFGDCVNPDVKVYFGVTQEVPMYIYETIKNHEKYVQQFKRDPQTKKLTNEIIDSNVHFRCDDLGDVYK